MPPTIAPVWDALLDSDATLPLAVEVELAEPEPDPDTLFKRTLGGRVETAAVGCVPISPLPIKTIVPLLGMPDIVTNNKPGPGWNKFGLGGS